MILEKQDIEKDQKDLRGKSSDIESRARDGLAIFTLQARLLESELLSSLKKVRFGDHEFTAGTPISNIKYNQPGF